MLDLESRAGSPLAWSLAAGTFAGWAAIGQAWTLSRALDAVFLRGSQLQQVLPILAVFSALSLVRAAAGWLSDAASQRAAALVKVAARTRLLDHLLSLGPAFVSRHRVGEISTIATDGIETLDGYVGQFLPQRLLALLVPLSVVAAVLLVDPLSALVMLLTGPLIPLFLWLVGGAAAGLSRRQWRIFGRLSAQFLDGLYGLATLKAFGRSLDQVDRIERSTESFRQATMHVLRLAFLSSMTLEWLATLSTALVAVQVGLRLLYGRLAFEQAIFVLLLAPEFYLPLRTLGTRFHLGTAGREMAEAVFRLLDEGPSLPAQGPPRPATHLSPQAALAFDHVSFAYPPKSVPAVHELSFEVAHGTRLAVLGPSGAGKTTLAYLALQLIRPTSGRLLFSGQPAPDSQAAAWRRTISWLPQSPSLLEGTIEHNIRIARPDCSPLELIAASDRAGAHAFIQMLPAGYATLVGSEGIRLSAGEVKRIGLARAFLRDAPLWILDEPTALLDADLEVQVRQALASLPADRTLVLIAHRLAGLPPCDEILVLAGGRLVEAGEPATLMKTGRVYPQLVAAYEQG